MPVDIDPKDSLYYKGALILKLFKNKRVNEIKLTELALYLREEITINSLILTLDWLFIANIAIIDDEGVVRLCT